MSTAELHARIRLSDPKDWVLYLSPRPAKRLVVFVHGFRGRAEATWRAFPEVLRDQEWWLDCDLLFVGYDSMKYGITAVANRIRVNIGRFYPLPPAEAFSIAGAQPRQHPTPPYEQLIIAGHSLGGLISRRVLVDAFQAWKEDDGEPGTPRPALLTADLRLFSPANAGFRAGGLLGAIRATGWPWSGIEIYLRRSSAYSDLQPGSPVLEEIRRRTEAAAAHPDAAALRARILWAEKENVVIAESYSTDFVDASAPDRDHIDVCKPDAEYDLPWRFVRTGKIS